MVGRRLHSSSLCSLVLEWAHKTREHFLTTTQLPPDQYASAMMTAQSTWICVCGKSGGTCYNVPSIHSFSHSVHGDQLFCWCGFTHTLTHNQLITSDSRVDGACLTETQVGWLVGKNVSQCSEYTTNACIHHRMDGWAHACSQSTAHNHLDMRT